MKRFYLAFALGFLCYGSAQGQTIGINYGVGWDPGVSENSVGVLVADTLGDGFAGIDSSPISLLNKDLTVGAFLDSDDLILHKTTATPTGSGFGFSGSLISQPLVGDLTPGDEVAIYWFDDPSTDPIALGQTGGWYRTNDVDTGINADSPWVIPNAGFNVNVISISTSFGGIQTDSIYNANDFVVIPEPQTGVLLVLSVVAFALRRKRRG